MVGSRRLPTGGARPGHHPDGEERLDRARGAKGGFFLKGSYTDRAFQRAEADELYTF